ncbi:MAG: hypothetical protein H6725_19325 [Sandaracinaceae bacterium]|nr:hypothetical protein [Sandaracinaceae bacterium]
MSDLSDESRALLALEAELDEPTAAELDVRRLAVFQALGVPAPPSAPGPGLDAPQPSGADAPLGTDAPAAPAAPGTPAAPAGTAPGTPAAPGAPAAPAAPTAPASPAALGAGTPVGTKVLLALVATGALVAAVTLLAPRPGQPEPTDTAQGSETTPALEAPADAPDAVDPTAATDASAGHEPASPDGADPTPPGSAPGPAALRREGAARPSEDTQDTMVPSVPPLTTPEPAVVVAPTAPPEDPAAAADPMSEESMLVAAGEAQLRAGHAAEALTLFDRALARHPRGALRVEALAGRALALCRAGRMDAGQLEAERFLTSYPRSPSAPRIRAACQVEP